MVLNQSFIDARVVHGYDREFGLSDGAAHGIRKRDSQRECASFSWVAGDGQRGVVKT